MKVKFQGQEVTIGNVKNVGDMAPEVVLVNKDLSEVKVGGSQGFYQIINFLPSLDTGVCATQTRTFNKKAAEIPNVKVFVISMDLPFAQGRFCSTEGIEKLEVLSDFRNREFANKYGVMISDSALAGLLTRGVIVVNPQGQIIYQEICEEITNEPNYEAPIKSIQ